MEPRKVVIADPSEEFREALALALSPDFRVHCCARGDAALKLLSAEMPDLLILDLALPGLEGISLLEQLPMRPPVLVVTDLINPYIQSSLARLRVEYAIRKPCSIQSVARRAFDLVGSGKISREQICLQKALIGLGIPNGRQGFQHLLTGLPLLAEQRNQQLSKELYTAIASLDRSTPAAVEKAIREVIRDGWNSGSHREWNRLFPTLARCPRNKEFLFRMADLFREQQLCG